MDFEILTESDETFVAVRVDADVTNALALEFVTAAMEEMARTNRDGLLLDLRSVRGVDSVSGNYRFAESLLEMQIDRRMRVAAVVASTDSSFDFAQTTTRNRGFNVKLFKDIDEARAWLSA